MGLTLTKRLSEIVLALQNGAAMITDDRSAILEYPDGKIDRLTLSTFYKLVNMGMIAQDMRRNFNYYLTQDGESWQKK